MTKYIKVIKILYGLPDVTNSLDFQLCKAQITRNIVHRQN